MRIRKWEKDGRELQFGGYELWRSRREIWGNQHKIGWVEISRNLTQYGSRLVLTWARFWTILIWTNVKISLIYSSISPGKETIRLLCGYLSLNPNQIPKTYQYCYMNTVCCDDPNECVLLGPCMLTGETQRLFQLCCSDSQKCH